MSVTTTLGNRMSRVVAVVSRELSVQRLYVRFAYCR